MSKSTVIDYETLLKVFEMLGRFAEIQNKLDAIERAKRGYVISTVSDHTMSEEEWQQFLKEYMNYAR